MNERLSNLLANTADMVDLIGATASLLDIVVEIDDTNKLNLRSLLHAERILLEKATQDARSICREIDQIIMDYDI